MGRTGGSRSSSCETKAGGWSGSGLSAGSPCGPASSPGRSRRRVVASRRTSQRGFMAVRLKALRNAATLISLLAMTVAGCRPGTPPRTDTAASASRLMTFTDLQKLPSLAPDQRIAYGQDSSQYGELRVPGGAGPHPVAVLIHGGRWKAAYAQAAELGQMGDA